MTSHGVVDIAQCAALSAAEMGLIISEMANDDNSAILFTVVRVIIFLFRRERELLRRDGINVCWRHFARR